MTDCRAVFASFGLQAAEREFAMPSLFDLEEIGA